MDEYADGSLPVEVEYLWKYGLWPGHMRVETAGTLTKGTVVVNYSSFPTWEPIEVSMAMVRPLPALVEAGECKDISPGMCVTAFHPIDLPRTYGLDPNEIDPKVWKEVFITDAQNEAECTEDRCTCTVSYRVIKLDESCFGGGRRPPTLLRNEYKTKTENIAFIRRATARMESILQSIPLGTLSEVQATNRFEKVLTEFPEDLSGWTFQKEE